MAIVLLVDDDPGVVEAFSHRLKLEQYDVHTANTLYEAMKEIQENDFDFAVLDIRLDRNKIEPIDESGMLLAAYINALRLKTKVIILSSYNDLPRRIKAVRYMGVEHFVDKRSGAIELINILNQLRERKDPTDVTTKLTFSLANGQPVVIHASGEVNLSDRTQRNVHITLPEYSRWLREIEDAESIELKDINAISRQLTEKLLLNEENIRETVTRAQSGRNANVLYKFEVPIDLLDLPVEFLQLGEKQPQPISKRITGITYQPNNEPVSPGWMAHLMTRDDTNLRILIVSSDTRDGISHIDREGLELEKFFNSRKAEGFPVEVNFIPTEKANFSHILDDQLPNNRYDIIHFIGHSDFNPDKPHKSALTFWEHSDRMGRICSLTAQRLFSSLQGSSTKLVFLNSCSSGRSGLSDDMDNSPIGLSESVIRARIPTAVGYRWPISDAIAIDFALDFYDHLLEIGDVELSLWLSRKNLWRRNPDRPTWLSPIVIHQA